MQTNDIGIDRVATPNIDWMKMDLWGNVGKKAGDFVSRPNQPVQHFSENDTLVGYKGELVDMAPLMQVQQKA